VEAGEITTSGSSSDPDQHRVEELLDRYPTRFNDDFAAAMPMRQSPTE